jgi:hypothetical protein
VSENTTGKELEISQHLVNTNSTVIQQPSNVDFKENESTVDETKNTEAQGFIQHTTKDKGERVDVEQAQLDGVLQTEPAINFSSTCSTHIETSSHSNPLNPIFTSQHKSFQVKYQPIEVRNSEGKWISGYFVHKCLVVANLAGVERKYALYDESGAKYVFLGEIRLPRGK